MRTKPKFLATPCDSIHAVLILLHPLLALALVVRRSTHSSTVLLSKRVVAGFFKKILHISPLVKSSWVKIKYEYMRANASRNSEDWNSGPLSAILEFKPAFPHKYRLMVGKVFFFKSGI